MQQSPGSREGSQRSSGWGKAESSDPSIPFPQGLRDRAGSKGSSDLPTLPAGPRQCVPAAKSPPGCSGLTVLESGALSPSCHFVSFFFKGNSAVGGENEQAANERAAAALCQARETLLGAQLDAVGGWTPFIFTLELFSSHPVCSLLFISESVHPLSDGHRCRM